MAHGSVGSTGRMRPAMCSAPEETSGNLKSLQKAKGEAAHHKARTGGRERWRRNYTLLNNQISEALTHSLSWEQHQVENPPPWSNHVPPGPTSNIEDYNSTWDLGGHTDPNHIKTITPYLINIYSNYMSIKNKIKQRKII